MHIRAEIPADSVAIFDVIERAFAGHPFGACTEHIIVRALRDAGALSVSRSRHGALKFWASSPSPRSP